MKKVLPYLLVLLMTLFMLVTFSLSGCKEEVAPVEEVEEEEVVEEEVVEEEVVEEEAEAGPWVIGFNNYADSHEFCYKVHEGIEEAAEEYGVELLYTEAEMDGTRMTSNTQSLIDQGAQVIIDFNWIPEVGATMLDMCKEAGVVLISMDTVYEGTYYFGTNSYEAGRVLAERAVKDIKEVWDGEVEALVGLCYMGGGDVVLDRVTGFYDYLDEEAADISLPDESNRFEFDVGAGEQVLVGRDTITDFLTAHPDLHKILVVAHNDETGSGAFAGVELSGREDDVMIFSHGGDTPFHEHVRGGGGDVWIASVSYAPETYGSQVIPMAIDILEGKDVPMNVYLNHFTLDKDNLDEYYPE